MELMIISFNLYLTFSFAYPCFFINTRIDSKRGAKYKTGNDAFQGNSLSFNCLPPSH